MTITKEIKIFGVTGNGEIITSTGKWFNVFDPNPDDVDIEDIAHALSNQCRFTGHTRGFYSVAQHSVTCSYLVEPEYALQALLHDASEAYLSDIARPVKKHADFGPFYLDVESRLTDAVMDHFNIAREFHPSVIKADDKMLCTEAHWLMPDTFPVYGEHLRENWVLPTQDPSTAYLNFMDRYGYITGR